MANYNVGILQTSVNAQNNHTLTSSAPTDVFKFELNQSGTINLNLHDISSGDDADLYLYRDNGNGYLDSGDTRITSSRNGGNSNDTIAHSATAGTYFAEVERYAN
ncbi:MAG: PPC domain-containing protein, partial [Cyanobacteria bacterium P01_G01_bin.54]